MHRRENTYRLFNSDYWNWQTVKLVEKSIAVGGSWYLTQDRNIMAELYSCIASESRKFFKRVFYLKQINFITGAPLQRGARGNFPRCPSLIRPCRQKVFDWGTLRIYSGIMGVSRNFSRRGAKPTFCLSFSGCWRCNANLHIQKRKCPMLWQQLHTVLSL